jgi:ribosome-associated protein
LSAGELSVLGSKEKALLSAKIAQDKKGDNIVILDVGSLTTLADFFVICSANSQRQVLAITDAIDEELSRKGVQPMSLEGRENSLWVLMDYGEVIVHIFKEEVRDFYDLERLWGDAKRLPLPRAKSMALGKN